MQPNNPYQNVFIEFHILQSFPVTCLNRDDVGAPKTAFIGGVQRARVSSQCWKRQVRMQLRELGVPLANRTKYVNALIERACLEHGATETQAKLLGSLVSNELSGGKEDSKSTTLLFISQSEANSFAKAMEQYDFSFEALDNKIKDLDGQIKSLKSKKKNKEPEIDKDELAQKEMELKALKKARKIEYLFHEGFSPAIDGLDIALFGRMVANAPSMHVEAAAAFSHAISTHKASNEIEFFTAMDDHPEENTQGSAHMGTLEFNSATYYRYVSLNLGQLWQTLGDSVPLSHPTLAFIKALYLAIPTARQATQSGACPWEFAKILVRKGQRIQIPFETPVSECRKVGGFLKPSQEKLVGYLDKQAQLSGSLFGKQLELTYGEGHQNIDTILEQIENWITRYETNSVASSPSAPKLNQMEHTV